jgi:hypothetical protein
MKEGAELVAPLHAESGGTWDFPERGADSKGLADWARGSRRGNRGRVGCAYGALVAAEADAGSQSKLVTPEPRRCFHRTLWSTATGP